MRWIIAVDVKSQPLTNVGSMDRMYSYFSRENLFAWEPLPSSCSISIISNQIIIDGTHV